MKKSLSMLLCVVILCSTLVGCEKKIVNNTTSSGASKKQTSSTTPVTSDSITSKKQSETSNKDNMWEQADKDNQLLDAIGFGFGWSRAIAMGYGNKIYLSDITPKIKEQYAAIEKMYKDGKHLRDVVMYMGYKDPGAELSDILVNDLTAWGKLPS